MTPPVAQGDRHIAEAPDAPPAVSVCPAPAGPLVLETLQNRPDFLKAASARRQGTASCLVQARDRRDETALVRVGFTASKKIGNAVARNRAKRRMRALARAVLAEAGRPGWDYVLIGRAGATAELAFDRLRDDLDAAVAAVHEDRRGGPR